MPNKRFVDALKLFTEREQRMNPDQQRGLVMSVSGDFAMVRVSGSRQQQPAYITSGLKVMAEDTVVLVPTNSQKRVRWLINGVINTNQRDTAKPTKRDYSELFPPSNIRVEDGAPGMIIVIWDAPIAQNVSFEVQKSSDGTEENASLALITRGSYALLVGSTNVHSRVRSVAPDGQRSPWSAWVQASSDNFTATNGFIEYPFTFNNQSFEVIEVADGTLIRSVQVVIDEAFDNSAMIQIGEIGTPDRLVKTNEVFMSQVGQYTVAPLFRYTADTSIQATIFNSPMTGSGRILVHF